MSSSSINTPAQYSSASIQQLLDSSSEAENLARLILHSKEELVSLDKRRHDYMEALAALRRQQQRSRSKHHTDTHNIESSTDISSSSHPTHHTPKPLYYTYVGNIFIQLPFNRLQEILTDEKNVVDNEIQNIRNTMKSKMLELQQIITSTSREKYMTNEFIRSALS